jgi:hypothetical protein
VYWTRMGIDSGLRGGCCEDPESQDSRLGRELGYYRSLQIEEIWNATVIPSETETGRATMELMFVLVELCTLATSSRYLCK